MTKSLISLRLRVGAAQVAMTVYTNQSLPSSMFALKKEGSKFHFVKWSHGNVCTEPVMGSPDALWELLTSGKP